MAYGIHWFRRDLRIGGNPALEWSRREHQGQTVGVFFIDPDFLKRPDCSVDRFGFLLETLQALREELRSSGGDLRVIESPPAKGFEKLIDELRKTGRPPASVSWNRDYEPYARRRDKAISQLLQELGVQVRTERDHLVIEPWELLKDDGTPYKVYTPFSKRWQSLVRSSGFRDRIRPQPTTPVPDFTLQWKSLVKATHKNRDCLDRYLEENRKLRAVPLPPAGEEQALRRLKRFASEALDGYTSGRDIPGIDGTSRISAYLKNGSLTVSQVIVALELGGGSKGEKFLSELIWREFYYSILWHYPEVERHSFNPKFEELKWENDRALFEAWKAGRTGYPIVDAGMRQLDQTGWMHNRVRMIVASFLVKDLLISWRWGERYFMRRLLDGDLAANNGGWQWVASTGCDPQPYFRIFNPLLQSKKFDPEGTYIRRYVPELAALDNKRIHEPGEAARGLGYPDPVIDHAARKTKALRMYNREL